MDAKGKAKQALQRARLMITDALEEVDNALDAVGTADDDEPNPPPPPPGDGDGVTPVGG